MTKQLQDQPAEPYYLIHEELLRRNLDKISNVAKSAGIEIILAFKAYALWKTFNIFREYINSTTASSPFEARLAKEKFKTLAHTYSPAYEYSSFHTIMECSQTVTFNSLSQYERFYPLVNDWNHEKKNHKISVGLRINPEYSEIATEIYNPCTLGSRFGVIDENLTIPLPQGISGFHIHSHCESDSYALEHTLDVIDKKFGKWLPELKWLNLGGGHLMTRKGYDLNHLIDTICAFKNKYPNLKIILEPGSAFAWQTGELISTVTDTVENHGIKTAILNVSFTCHMPDCLEMPYQPDIIGARSLGNITDEKIIQLPNVWRLGGNSCLSGDWMGYWQFPDRLKVGDKVIFLDMMHYTTVKTTMFNGIRHPSIYLREIGGQMRLLRKYTYNDYKRMMD